MNPVLLHEIPLFRGLTPAQYNLIQDMVAVWHYVWNDRIFKQGEAASTIYVVLDGEVQIRYKPHDGPDLEVATIYPNGIFGWSAALGHPLYTSSASAACNVRVLAINGVRLRCICQEQPEMGVLILGRMAEVVADRLRTTREQIVQLLSSEMEYNKKYMERRE